MLGMALLRDVMSGCEGVAERLDGSRLISRDFGTSRGWGGSLSHVNETESPTSTSSHLTSHSQLTAKIRRWLWRNLAGRQCLINQVRVPGCLWLGS